MINTQRDEQNRNKSFYYKSEGSEEEFLKKMAIKTVHPFFRNSDL